MLRFPLIGLAVKRLAIYTLDLQRPSMIGAETCNSNSCLLEDSRTPYHIPVEGVVKEAWIMRSYSENGTGQ